MIEPTDQYCSCWFAAKQAEYRSLLDGLAVSPALADVLVAEANYAFELNTSLFHELDRLAGFAPSESPVPLPGPPDVHTVVTAAALPSTPVSDDGSASAAGCPFAGLAKLGVPMPAHHPSGDTKLAQPTKSTKTPGSCPIRSFGVVDVAVVLILVAVMLLCMPPMEKINHGSSPGL